MTTEIKGVLTRTNAPAQTGGDEPAHVATPQHYAITLDPTGVGISLTTPEGTVVSDVFIELGGDGKTPVVRIWDGEQGTGNDPIYTRNMIPDTDEEGA